MSERSAQLVLQKRPSKVYRAIEQLCGEDNEWVHIDKIGEKLKAAEGSTWSIFALENALDKPSTWTDDVIATTLVALENKDVIRVKEDDDGHYYFRINNENDMWVPYPLESKQKGDT